MNNLTSAATLRSAGPLLAAAADREIRWLGDAALPLWASRGLDSQTGIFHERLGLDGVPIVETRRARVQARQVYCYAVAAERGWFADAAKIAGLGLDALLKHNLRRDGLLLHLIGASGEVVDEGPELYDQAFLLLALAKAHRNTGDPALVTRAFGILDLLRSEFAHDAGGFRDRPGRPSPMRSNPHMHLLEAAMAWIETADDPRWRGLANEAASLCGSVFRASESGALLENFDKNWLPIKSGALARIEPGHLYEWAWLLKRWQRISGQNQSHIYERFYELANSHGLCPVRNVAIDAMAPDFTWLTSQARLWPQTERLKAALILLEDDRGKQSLAESSLSAIASLDSYRAGVMPGLWRDKLNGDGSFAGEPAPASTFYHFVCAIDELSRVANSLANP